MCRMLEFTAEYFDDLPAYILDTKTFLTGIERIVILIPIIYRWLEATKDKQNVCS